MNRIILTTRGSRGHIFPALAVAEQLRREGAELLFVGSEYGSEAGLAGKRESISVACPCTACSGGDSVPWGPLAVFCGLFFRLVPSSGSFIPMLWSVLGPTPLSRRLWPRDCAVFLWQSMNRMPCQV